MRPKHYIASLMLMLGGYAQAQVGIPNTNSTDPSAELKVESPNATKRGVLFPILSNTQMLSIANPANGLLVFESTGNVLKYYDGTLWQNVNSIPQYTTATLPTAPNLFTGELIFNTTDNELYFYNGTAWEKMVKKAPTNRLPN